MTSQVTAVLIFSGIIGLINPRAGIAVFLVLFLAITLTPPLPQ